MSTPRAFPWNPSHHWAGGTLRSYYPETRGNKKTTTTSTDSRITVEKPTTEKLDKLKVSDWSIWTKEPSVFDWHYDDQETCYFLEGAVTVKTDRGEVSIGKGDLVTFPKGLSCTWHVEQAVRKHYRFE